MVCGTPVIAFANSPLPEVVGDAGILVEYGDTEAIAVAMHRLPHDSDERGALNERGLSRAARFRWADTVDAHVELLRSVIG